MPEKAPDEVVELRVGDRHEVRLPGIGTAGYRWRPEPEGEKNVAEVSAAPGGASHG